MKKYMVFIGQINQQAFEVNAESVISAQRGAVSLWRKENKYPQVAAVQEVKADKVEGKLCMSEQLYVCEKGCKFETPCYYNKPHKHDDMCSALCSVKDCKCAPCASQANAATKSPVATERGTSDPDAVLAREYAEKCGGRHGNACSRLLLRLADKVEGKK